MYYNTSINFITASLKNVDRYKHTGCHPNLPNVISPTVRPYFDETTFGEMTSRQNDVSVKRVNMAGMGKDRNGLSWQMWAVAEVGYSEMDLDTVI